MEPPPSYIKNTFLDTEDVFSAWVADGARSAVAE